MTVCLPRGPVVSHCQFFLQLELTRFASRSSRPSRIIHSPRSSSPGLFVSLPALYSPRIPGPPDSPRTEGEGRRGEARRGNSGACSRSSTRFGRHGMTPAGGVRVSDPTREMIPRNENEVPVAQGTKELSWIDRMQQKLETLCETDAGRNSTEVLQETSTFFESQISTLGTNVRKFCAEFVQELLLPADSDEKSDVSRTENPQTETETTNSAGVEKAAVKVVDSPVFHLEGSSVAVMPVIATKDVVQPSQARAHSKEIVDEQRSIPSNEASNSSVFENSQVACTASEQSELDMSASSSKSKEEEEDGVEYAHWFVSEEYRKMRLGKSSSTSSVESWDGHQRAPSTDSLLDWELI